MKRWIFESSVAAATCDLSETPGNYEIEERSDRRADDVALWKGKRNAGGGRFEEVAEVEKEDGGVISSVRSVQSGERFSLRLSDGSLTCRVEGTEEENSKG